MSKIYLKEACELYFSTQWTAELMQSTLHKVMLENPAAFIKAVKPTEKRVLISITDYRQENKIAVLKAFREVTGVTLGHAKACVESAFPIYVITCTAKSSVSHIRSLSEAGATISKEYVAT